MDENLLASKNIWSPEKKKSSHHTHTTRMRRCQFFPFFNEKMDLRNTEVFYKLIKKNNHDLSNSTSLNCLKSTNLLID